MGLRAPNWGKFQPTKSIEGSAYRLAQTLLRFDPGALVMVKEVEHRAYQRVISPFEREHLLLNV